MRILKSAKIFAATAFTAATLIAAPATPAHAADLHLIGVTFETVTFNSIDDSGAYWPAWMSHVAQMYGRYGAKVTGASEQWKMIGTWGAVGTSKMPGTPPYNDWNCYSDTMPGHENSTLCMWNVGQASFFPNGGAPTFYGTGAVKPPATAGAYKLTDFPTCKSFIKPTDASPYCVDQQRKIQNDTDYLKGAFNNRFLLFVQGGQNISLDMELEDYDYSSGNDRLCGADNSFEFNSAFSDAELVNIDKTVALNTFGDSGNCTVKVHFVDLSNTI